MRVCFFALLCVACGGPNEASAGFPEAPYASFEVDGQPLKIELRTAPDQPPVRGEIRAELRITDVSGAPRDGLTIEVVPWMPAHGHGSNVTPIVEPSGAGVYRIEHLELPMPGTWQLRLGLKASDLDAHATATLDVR